MANPEIFRCVFGFAISVFVLQSSALTVPDKQRYIIGGFMPAPIPTFLDLWKPILETYLNDVVGRQYDPPIQFSLVPVNFAPENRAQDLARQGLLDFVYLDPVNLACLEAIGFSTLVTQRSKVGSREASGYGGIIYTSKRNTISSLADIKNKKVAVGTILAAGAFSLPWQLLTQNNINLFTDVEQVIFYATDFVRAMNDVRSGAVDVGFTASAWFETNYPNLMGEFNFLHLVNSSLAAEPYPFLTSTDIIPGFGVAAAPAVPWLLRGQVAAALQALNASNPIARRASIATFTTAASYQVPRVNSMDLGVMFRNGSTYDCQSQFDGTYDLLTCPPRHLKAARADALRGCAAANLSCPAGLLCLCRPCTPDLDVQLYPWR